MSDFRLQVTFFGHPKTVKLIRRTGIAGAWSFLQLLAFATSNRPKGRFDGMDAEDIEIAAGWDGDPGRLVAELLSVGFLDEVDETLCVHDWEEHNPYAAHSEERSLAAKRSIMVRWAIEELKRQGREKEIATFKEWLSEQAYRGDTWEEVLRKYNQYTGRIRSKTGSNTPSPSPFPFPKDDNNSSSFDEENAEPVSYRTKKGRNLSGKQLEWFERFWLVFDYKSGKAEAADTWLDLRVSEKVLDDILAGARREAASRKAIRDAGRTPKMAQGWLSGRRWEDEAGQVLSFAQRDHVRVQEDNY